MLIYPMLQEIEGKRLLNMLSSLNDQQWLEVLIKSLENPAMGGIALPGTPSDQVQRDTVGSAGEQALSEAFSFYREIKKYGSDFGKVLTPDSRILDFGCGWGRIIRFFLKEVKADNLHGIDVTPQMIDFCRELFRYGNFSICNPLPPTEFADESFDIIYAYSVFSHLSESVHIRWVEEFSRILKPGGIFIATTQARHFIEFCRSLQDRTHESGWHRALSKAFLDTKVALADYDNGKFLFCATGGGPSLPNSFYGEALIPRAYVEREWTKYLILRDFVDDQNRLPQAIIVMQKPDSDLHEYADRLKELLSAKDARIRNLERCFCEREKQVQGVDTTRHDKDDHIDALESLLREKERTLNRIYRSRGWKVLTIYYKIRDTILRR
jgi:SAM-dependent methyltransferase